MTPAPLHAVSTSPLGPGRRPTPGQRHHILSVLVENKAGVLARVAGLFSRRGFNIYSLAVAPTDEDEHFSRITIVVDFRTDAREKVYPMVAAGSSNDDIVVHPDQLKAAAR